MSTEALKALVDALEKRDGVAKMQCQAYGSGDEGSLQEIELYNDSDEIVDDDCQELFDLVDAAFEENGFDYYNGNGGELHIEINVKDRTCSWSKWANDLVECGSEENEV